MVALTPGFNLVFDEVLLSLSLFPCECVYVYICI